MFDTGVEGLSGRVLSDAEDVPATNAVTSRSA
jgi:hypothetical protein